MLPYKPMEEEGTPDDQVTFGGHVEPSRPVVISPGPGLQAPNQSQSPQVILVVPSSQMLTPISDKKAKILLGMGATQLALGILEIVLNIGASIMWAHVAYFVGPGYWCGIFAILAGAFGIAAGKRKGKCMTITFMVMSIIATVLTVGIIVASAVGIADSPSAYNYYNPYYDYYNSLTDQYSHNYYHKVNIAIAWNALLLVAGIIEFIISIVSAAMCCSALCGGKSAVMHPGVQYLNGSQHTNINGQVVTATSWFPAPSQAGAPVQPNVVHQPMMIPQAPSYASDNSPPPAYECNKQ